MKIDFSNRDLYNYKYIPLLHCKKRYIFMMGGAGSGKSVFQAQKEIIKTFEHGNKLMVVRKVKDTHKDSTYSELKSVIDKWELHNFFDITISPLSITNRLTKSSIIFRGMDDPEKIKSVQGINRIWIEEATELKKEDFNQLDLRLRGKKEIQMTCTFNPISSEHWLNTDFWQFGNTEEIELMHSTYLDNRFVGDKYKEVMERLKTQNPTYYKIYAKGEWGTLEGLVFEILPVEIDMPDGAKIIGYGLDFGYTNDPTSLVAIYEWNGGVIMQELLYKTGMTNQDIVNYLKSLNIDRYTDIYADSSEPKSIEEIYRAGFNIKPVKKGADSIMYGIDMMKQHKLYITKDSYNGIKEFKNYIWAKDKNGKAINKPVDYMNHFLDATRYAFMMSFGNKVTFDIEIG